MVMGLREVADYLGVKYWRIDYAHRSGAIPDVRMVGGRRVYGDPEIRMVAQHFGVDVPEEGR